MKKFSTFQNFTCLIPTVTNSNSESGRNLTLKIFFKCPDPVAISVPSSHLKTVNVASGSIPTDNKYFPLAENAKQFIPWNKKKKLTKFWQFWQIFYLGIFGLKNRNRFHFHGVPNMDRRFFHSNFSSGNDRQKFWIRICGQTQNVVAVIQIKSLFS